ncbi:MAG: cupin domain-containing protein [Planctomycetia bacterium]|nr:cupin domain-containing protein [Planctomycetia bacterium]
MKKVCHSQQVPAAAANVPGAARCKMRVLVGPDDGAPTFAMRQFEVEPGGHTPMHTHPWEHEIYILQGAATITMDSEEHPARPGCCAFIPPNVPHQIANAGLLELKFLCLIPIECSCGCPVK